MLASALREASSSMLVEGTFELCMACSSSYLSLHGPLATLTLGLLMTGFWQSIKDERNQLEVQKLGAHALNRAMARSLRPRRCMQRLGSHACASAMPVWPSGRVAGWPGGRVAVWPCGRVAVWPRGRVAVWP
eukprot:6180499-Pleurochrysis_carterae.AAC.6